MDPATDNMIVRAAIHRAIGIDRIGNSNEPAGCYKRMTGLQARTGNHRDVRPQDISTLTCKEWLATMSPC